MLLDPPCSQTSSFRSVSLSRCKGLSLALSDSGYASALPFVGPSFPRLNVRPPCGLPGENGWVIGCRACPQASDGGLSRLRGCLKSINELAGFELTHEHSL